MPTSIPFVRDGQENLIPMNQRALDLPKGTDEYERKRNLLRQELSDKIPKHRWLDAEVVQQVEKDVSNVIKSSKRLTAREIEITEQYDAVSLLAAIAKGQLTSMEVTEAFCKRAVMAHQLTGCLVDYFEEEAFLMAKRADDYLCQTGKTLGPLHGLPISIKDHMPLKGHPHSTGFLSTRQDVSEVDCLLVSILRNAGAIFYVKTNQPQAIMHLECTSFMWRTLNPFNTLLSAGGSSGGEGALIAMRGSILGLGTDIGGSIRGPSSFCGIWGFKPSSQIVPLTGMPVGVLSAPISIQCCGGPMTVSLGGVDLFMRTVLEARPERVDSQLTRWTWPTKIETPVKRVRIGIMFDDGHIVPQPPVRNALTWAKKKLEMAKMDVELVPYTPYGAAEANKLIHSLYYPTGSEELRQVLQDGGEPEYSLTTNTLRETGKKPKDAFGIVENNVKLQDFRLRFTQHYNSFDLDAVLGPCFVGTACEHDTALFWNYTSLWNIMDWPAFVFPTTIIASGSESYDDEIHARSLSPESAKVVEMWKAGDFSNAPVNLQLASRRHYDNDLRAVLGLVLNAVGYGPLK